MKFIALAALLLSTPVLAQTVGENIGINDLLDRPPSGTDLLIDIHRFDLFQKGADEMAQQRGDDGLREFSRSHADAATRQDRQLAALRDRAAPGIALSEDPDLAASGRLAGLQGAVGAAFVRQYYETQVSEYNAAVSALRRYLQSPDRDDIGAFAADLLPIFEADRKEARESWTRTRK